MLIDERITNNLRSAGQQDALDQSKPSSIDATIRLGQEAWVRVREGHSWQDWLLIGAAHCAGRNEAMREAHVNAPVGRNYSSRFNVWHQKYGFDGIDHGDRKRLFDVMDHLNEIQKWRATLPLNLRLTLNHPSVVLRRWGAATVVPDPNAPPKKPSPMAKLKDSVARLEEENYRVRKEIERGGGDLWTKNDKAEDIASIMLANLSVAKAEQVARALTKKIKEKRAAQPKCAGQDAAESAEERNKPHHRPPTISFARGSK